MTCHGLLRRLSGLLLRGLLLAVLTLPPCRQHGGSQPAVFRNSTTQYSTRSLNAAACVTAQGGSAAFLKFHDLLYANQPAEGVPGCRTASSSTSPSKPV